MTHLGPPILVDYTRPRSSPSQVPTSQKCSEYPHSITLSLWLILHLFIYFFLGLTTHTKSKIIWQRMALRWKEGWQKQFMLFLTESSHCSPHSPQIFQCHLFILLVCTYFNQSIRTLEMFQVIFAFVEGIIGLMFFAYIFFLGQKLENLLQLAWLAYH